MKRWLIQCFMLILTLSMFQTASAESFERVYLYKVMDNEDKALVVRANGDMYLIEYGVGVLSIWRYEGNTVFISSPGLFAGVGAKIILPDDNQEARIWDSQFVENIKNPTPKVVPQPSYIPPTSTSQTVVKRPIYGKSQVIIAVDKAPVFSKPQNKPENIIMSLNYGTPLELDSVNLPGWNTIVMGKTALYVSKSHTTTYRTIQPKVISVKVEKGYLFNIPSGKGKALRFFPKNTLLIAGGENQNFWYVVYPNANGKHIFGFISKNVAY